MAHVLSICLVVIFLSRVPVSMRLSPVNSSAPVPVSVRSPVLNINPLNNAEVTGENVVSALMSRSPAPPRAMSKPPSVARV